MGHMIFIMLKKKTLTTHLLLTNPTQRGTGKNGVTDARLVIIEKHSCWICQEEMSSEALLLQHYENHMTHVCDDYS